MERGERISVMAGNGPACDIEIDIYPRELDVCAFPAAADVAIAVSYFLAALSIYNASFFFTAVFLIRL